MLSSPQCTELAPSIPRKQDLNSPDIVVRSLGKRLIAALWNPAWVFLTWFGMTAGVSLATPVKFTAPTITRSVALDVGSVTFALLNKAEIVALLMLLVIARFSGNARRWWGVSAVLALIVIAQTAWLLPELGERTQMVIDGIEPPSSHLHSIYVGLELAKLTILFVAGLVALNDSRRDA